MIRNAELKTRLANLLPQGTRYHSYSNGDYKWYVTLCFDYTEFPDGTTVSGDILSIDNFFGDLSYTLDGKTVLCSVKEQKQWTKEIMDIISRYTVK